MTTSLLSTRAAFCLLVVSGYTFFVVTVIFAVLDHQAVQFCNFVTFDPANKLCPAHSERSIDEYVDIKSKYVKSCKLVQ